MNSATSNPAGPETTTYSRFRGPCVFSPDMAHRYTLWREFDPDLLAMAELKREPTDFVQFIGLNPSTADDSKNDPTVRRCINYAKAWGFCGMVMTNIFSFRSTDPRGLIHTADPVGPDNDRWLKTISKEASLVIACWGTWGTLRERGAYVRRLIPSLHCLDTTRNGYPKHPLYLRKDLKPKPYK